MRNTVLITPPTLEPVTLTEVKAFCKITHGQEDTLLTGMISQARKLCENAARIAISPQTWAYTFRAPHYTSDDDFGLTRRLHDPDGVLRYISLPRPPHISVSALRYMKFDGSSEEASAEDFTLDVNRGSIFWKSTDRLLAWENSWLTVEVTSGFPTVTTGEGEDAVTVLDAPDDIKLAVNATVAHIHEHRGDKDGKLPARAVDALSPYWQTVTPKR